MRDLDRTRETESLLDVSKAFAFWIGKNYLHLTDDDDTKERICDGSNDQGIDAIFFDEADRIVHIINVTTVTTFDNTGKYLPETDVKVVCEGFRLITKGDYRDKLNPKLEDLTKEYHEKINIGGWKVRITLFHLCKGPAVRTYSDMLTKEFPDVDFSYVSFDGIQKSYQDYLSYQDPAPEKVLLHIIGGVLKKEDVVRSRVFTVSAKSLVEVFLTNRTSIFQRNIRYFLGDRSKSINAEIEKTASDPELSKRFWYFNNGITIICDKVEIPPPEEVAILYRMQIINGAQTTYSLVEAYSSKALQEDARVLVKVIESKKSDFIDDVTLYTNNQNPVNLRDLASREKVQTSVQKSLRAYKHFYERKRGEFLALYPTEEIRQKEFGADWKHKIISNEKAAQSFMAFYLNLPAQAKSAKRRIFIRGETGFYDQIFRDDVLPEQFLASFKLLEFVERQSDGYSKQYDVADKLEEKDRNELYKYDFILHSDFFILNLLRDFLLRSGLEFDQEGCRSIANMADASERFLDKAYETINELIREFVEKRKTEDKTYYHTKFFKNEASLGLIRDYVSRKPEFEFVAKL
jgi:hypothetical protein